MDTSTFAPGSAAETIKALLEFDRQNVRRFSDLCQKFFELERRDLLAKEPTEKDLRMHRDLLKRLLRMTRLLQAMAVESEIHDRAITSELNGRLIQLEHSWRQFEEPLPEAEAEKVLKQVFPE